jgi:L-ascorbate metabolism protein UlaG (beta-lactamase superfamily)
MMDIQLIRHATLWIEYAGYRLLVDPMLSEEKTLPPTPYAANSNANPLVRLPVPASRLAEADAVLLTHTHPDHWDEAAASILPRDIPLFCQEPDEAKLIDAGFQPTPISDSHTWGKLQITRTGGHHGFGDIERRMGQVSGFVLKAEGEPTLYIAGDTVWCEEVREALALHKPDVTILFAGGARFLMGERITMETSDIIEVCQSAPHTQIVIAHMEAWNHCLLSRAQLRRELEQQGGFPRVHIPADGQSLRFVSPD